MIPSATIIKPPHTSVSRETGERLLAYAALLRRWNARINLVSRADLDELERRHVEDSLQLLPLLPEGDGPAADLGSGAGLPGLVLALAEPGRAWHLVESDRRKAAFLQAAVGELGAANATVHVRRIEEVDLLPLAAVTARALAPLPALLAHAHRLLTPGTGVALFPKGRTAEAELTDAARAWTVARAERVASRTDPAATILRLSGIAPHRA